MCLLMTGKSKQIRDVLLTTPDLLDDIFKSNADGLGAMYATARRQLRTPKVLPKTLDDARRFIAQLPDDDRDLALHWRMRTHGDIDLANCHPYDVVEGRIALMHNGILSQGNKADKTKSDTWHYIKDVVRPQLEHAPKLYTVPAWQTLVESDIGDNRFAIIDHTGELVVLNKRDGIEHDGIWFSNTYAWSPEILIPGYRRKTLSWGGGYYAGTSCGRGSYLFGDEDDKDQDLVGEDGDTIGYCTADDVWDIIGTQDVDELADILYESPRFVLNTLFADCEFDPADTGMDHNKSDTEIIELLQAEDVDKLASRCTWNPASATEVAQIMAWYGDWVGKPINKRAAAEINDELAKLQEELKAEAYAG